DCSPEVRATRLCGPRGQPELATARMDTWAAYLRGEANALGLPVIDTTALTVAEATQELRALVDHLENSSVAEPTLSSLIGSVHRLGHEPPPLTAKLGWRYHHIGIPTSEPRPNETHLESFGLHVSGFSSSPFGIEWMRYSESSPLHPAIKTLPHVAFEVDDLDAALEGQEVISPPSSPSEGVRAAMILVEGAPVELIWLRRAFDEGE